MFEELENGEYYVTDFEAAKLAVKTFYLDMGHAPSEDIDDWCDINEFESAEFPRVFDFSMHYPCYADGCRNPDEMPFACTNNSYTHADALDMVLTFVKRGA